MKKGIVLIFILFFKIAFALSVEEAVEKGLKNFPDITISNREVDMQKFDIDSARGDFMPKLIFSSSYSHINPDDSPNMRTFNNELRLTYNLFSGFYSMNKLDISRYNLKIKETTLDSTRNLVAKNIKSAYFDALMYKKIYMFYDDLYKSAVKTYEFTKTKFEAGRALSIDVLKSLTDVKKYESKKVEQKSNLLNSLTILSYYTDEVYDINTELSSDFYELDLKERDYYLSKFIEKNPELAGFESKIKSSDAQLKQTRSSFMPTIDLFGAISREDAKKGGMESDTNSSSFGVSLSWNLFNGFKDKNDYEKQKLNYYNTLDQKRKFVNDSKRDIAVYYNKLLSAKENLVYMKELVKVAEQNFSLTSEAYELGRANLIELLRAKDELTSAKIDLINLLNSITQSYLNLEYITGGDI